MVLDWLDGPFGALAVAGDILVLANLAQLTAEAEYGAGAVRILHDLHNVFCGLYLVELLLRVWRQGTNFFGQLQNIVDTIIIGIGIVDTWFFATSTWLWTLTAIRATRFFRISEVAKDMHVFRDLWLVILGLQHSVRAIIWVGILLCIITFAWGGIASGLVMRGPASVPQDPDDCWQTFTQDLSDCAGLDAGEYFGSMAKTMLTLLQMVTLDQWASHVVRPLADAQPFTAIVLFLVVVVTAYGLLSIAIGIMVCSTVSLARSHQTHWSMMAMTEDLEIIEGLRSYFEASLELQDRCTIDKREIVDAMPVPQVASAFRQLELPVADIDELFRHLDTQRNGEITADEFERGLKKMKQPASRFDVACMTARLGGQVSMVGRLATRADESHGRLLKAASKLRLAFGGLAELSRPGGDMSQVPEVQLRKMRRIETVVETAPRFT